MTDQDPASPQPAYKNDDLVYVDPELRVVVGPVQFTADGRSKPLAMPERVREGDVKEKDDSGKPERKRRTRYYPWGTYRSMKRLYKLEGKVREEKEMLQLDEAIVKAMAEPFWD